MISFDTKMDCFKYEMKNKCAKGKLLEQKMCTGLSIFDIRSAFGFTAIFNE
jgi:hypothetical protein